MALTATIHNFDVQLADVDRNVYETLALRVARHPSETEEYLATRVLAYCLEYREGISFSKGLAEPDEPPIAIRDLTGALLVWVDIGAPDAARVHKASKAAPRVAIYTHKNPAQLQRQYAGERIHRADEIELYSFGKDLLQGFTSRLDRRMTIDMSVSDREIYLDIGGENISGSIERHPIQPAGSTS